MCLSLATAAITRMPVLVRCSSDVNPRRPTRRGFGAQDNTPSPLRRKFCPNQPGPAPTQALGLGPKYEMSYGSAADLDFEERLKTIKSVNQSEQTEAARRKLSEEQRATFQSRLKLFEATLISSPKDPMALEGAAVTLAELGESDKAASLLEELLKGIILKENGKQGEAERMFIQARFFSPEKAKALVDRYSR